MIIMRKKFLLLCLALTASICSFSQSTSKITITGEQLRTANLIFVEHRKLTETVPLLNKEINNLKLINKSWEKTDSLRRLQLTYYNDVIEDKNRSIEDLNKSLKRKQNIIKYGSAGSCLIIILCLLLK